jgi:hypothetical protein
VPTGKPRKLQLAGHRLGTVVADGELGRPHVHLVERLRRSVRKHHRRLRALVEEKGRLTGAGLVGDRRALGDLDRRGEVDLGHLRVVRHQDEVVEHEVVVPPRSDLALGGGVAVGLEADDELSAPVDHEVVPAVLTRQRVAQGGVILD